MDQFAEGKDVGARICLFPFQLLGSLLLDELARAAWQRGVEVFRADTLAENSAMLDVFRHAGFPVTSGIEYGTVTLRFPIAPTDDYRAALAARDATRKFPPEGTT